MTVPAYWDPADGSRFDTNLEELGALRRRIRRAMGKAEDDEAARQARIQADKERAQSLFEALKRDVENQKKDK